jgi:heat shock protein HtpX
MYAILLQLGYFVALIGGVQIGLTAIIVVSVIALLIDAYSYLQCDKIVLRATNAQVVTPSQAPELHAIVEELCIASGLPKPTVAIVEDPSLNAFATGRDPYHAAIAVNTGLLEALNKNQLRGVLGHEMAHIYNRDIFVNSVAAVCVRIVSAIANGFIFAGIAALTAPSAPGRKTQEQQNAENSQRAMGLGLLLIGGFLAITFVPALMLLQFAISRTRESMADLTGVKFTKDPEALSEALSILSGSTIPTYVKSAGTSHMWITKPLYVGGGLGNWVSSLTSSHPEPSIRISTLNAVANGQSVDLAMAKQMQSSGSIFGAGALALALVALPGYWIGTNPLHVGYGTTLDYGTDGNYDDTTDNSGDSNYPTEELNPDAEGGIGEDAPVDSYETDSQDATGGIGDSSGSDGESEDQSSSSDPGATGGIG